MPMKLLENDAHAKGTPMDTICELLNTNAQYYPKMQSVQMKQQKGDKLMGYSNLPNKNSAGLCKNSQHET